MGGGGLRCNFSVLNRLSASCFISNLAYVSFQTSCIIQYLSL